MVHRTEVLNRTFVSNRYFCNHCLNFVMPLKSTETLLIKKNTTITLYTTSCYSSYHHKHTFSDDQATFISWYWVFNWGNSRHICWGTSRGWTSSLSRLNIKSKQLVETKVLSMVKCFLYTHVYWHKKMKHVAIWPAIEIQMKKWTSRWTAIQEIAGKKREKFKLWWDPDLWNFCNSFIFNSSVRSMSYIWSHLPWTTPWYLGELTVASKCPF